MDARIIPRLQWLRYRLRARGGWTRAQLERHQTHALAALRRHVYSHSPFYQRFHRGLFDAPLDRLPVVTKAMMMEHFDEFVTDRRLRLGEVEEHVRGLAGDELLHGRYRVCATSGSTGRRGLFLFDRAEWAHILASFARGAEWAGGRVSLGRRMRFAAVASTTPWHMSSRASATLRNWWVPTLRLDAAAPLSETVKALNAWRPDTLMAYPSVARVLAEEQTAGRLQVSPRVLLTGSEVLTAETRQRLRAAFGVEPFDQYAATECAIMAAECPSHAGLHLFEDLVIFEVVDRLNRPVAPGEFGEKLLITVLFNRTQPLIRYEISDMISLSAEACPCGMPFATVEKVQGRVEEVLHLPARAGGEVALHPLVFHRVLDAAVDAAGWQVIHETGGLKILLSGAREGFDEKALLDSLRRELWAQGAAVPPLEVLRVREIPRSAVGKAPLIKSNVPRGTSHV